jgi:hypothetical protein
VVGTAGLQVGLRLRILRRQALGDAHAPLDLAPIAQRRECLGDPQDPVQGVLLASPEERGQVDLARLGISAPRRS